MRSGNWSGRNVLITGINGFIGSAVAKQMVKNGANVVGIVTEANNIRKDLQDCTLYMGDVCNYDFVRQVISYNEITDIFHFAAYAIVRVSAKDPVSAYKVNIMGTVNILEAARTVGNLGNKGCIVVASSDKAYGDHEQLPYKEDFALQPKNTYDTSKACMDMISRTYAHNYGLPVVVTRCSNVYGPGDLNLSRIVPNSIRRVLNGQRAQVYSDVSEMSREFIYIDDVVQAYDMLGYYGAAFKGEAFNIGGGGPTSIYDLVNLITKKVGSTLTPEVIERDSVFKEIQHQYIDAEKMAIKFGWEPKVSLEDGVQKSIDWYKDYLKCE